MELKNLREVKSADKQGQEYWKRYLGSAAQLGFFLIFSRSSATVSLLQATCHATWRPATSTPEVALLLF